MLRTRLRRFVFFGVPKYPTGNLIQEFETTRAFVAFEKGGGENGRVVQVGELLQEITPTPEDAAAPDTGFEPEGIVGRDSSGGVAVSKTSKRGLKNFARMIELQ